MHAVSRSVIIAWQACLQRGDGAAQSGFGGHNGMTPSLFS